MMAMPIGILSFSDNGLFKVNLEWPFPGLKFENLENEISVCVRNWELKTLILGS
jgi:hypothetical protein